MGTARDPFDVLQIEPSYSLDLAFVGKRHRELSSALHPDRYAGRPSAERRAALNRAIEVNEAFRTLKDPISRAEALLQRHGIEVGEAAPHQATPELLMEMMEVRERLAELKATGDIQGIEALSDEVRERATKAEHRVVGALRELGVARGAADEVSAALGELRYTRRFFDEVAAILDDLP